MNKRGMSQIVTTVILVVLVLVAIGIVWGVVSNLIGESSDDVNLEQFTTNLDVQSAYTSGDDVVVKVKRLAGKGDLTSIKFVVANGTDSEVIEQDVTLEELEEKSYVLTPTMPLASIQTVSITPVYVTGSGQEAIGGVSDTSNVGDSGVPIGGSANCGDGTQDVGEACDGADLGAYTTDCSTHPDFTGGVLSCTGSCTFNIDLCTGAICTPDGSTQDCSLIEGVCAGAQQTCTGGVWSVCDSAVYLVNNASYESTETSCTDGYDNDCNGLTDNEENACELTWTGTVGTPWPTETKILFDIVETTADFVTPTYIYTGMYMDFSGTSTETRCLQIHDYVTPSETPLFDKAIVRLDDTPVGGLPIVLLTGDTFTIYQKSECGV